MAWPGEDSAQTPIVELSSVESDPWRSAVTELGAWTVDRTKALFDITCPNPMDMPPDAPLAASPFFSTGSSRARQHQQACTSQRRGLASRSPPLGIPS